MSEISFVCCIVTGISQSYVCVYVREREIHYCGDTEPC